MTEITDEYWARIGLGQEPEGIFEAVDTGDREGTVRQVVSVWRCVVALRVWFDRAERGGASAAD